MTAVTLGEQADCLIAVGRLDEAIERNAEAIKRSEILADLRQVAVVRGQLASIRILQERYQEALAIYNEVLLIFQRLNEPREMAITWHQIGIVYRAANDYENAENSFRHALEIRTKIQDRRGQAETLTMLGNLYDIELKRLEEAITFYRQAGDIFIEIGDTRNEAILRNNLADGFRKIHRFNEARAEISRVIELNMQFGHITEPWKSYNILQAIETDVGNQAAAYEAWRQGRSAYLAYRRQNGYPQTPSGQLVDQILMMIKSGHAEEAIVRLGELELQFK